MTPVFQTSTYAQEGVLGPANLQALLYKVRFPDVSDVSDLSDVVGHSLGQGGRFSCSSPPRSLGVDP